MQLLRRVLVLVGIAVLGVAVPAEAAPKGKLVLDVRTRPADVTNIDQGTPNNSLDQGERITGFGTVLRKGTNRRIGTVHFDQTVTQLISPGSDTQPPVGRGLGHLIYELRGGNIFVMYMASEDARGYTEVGAIIGGTGRYKDARGESRLSRFLEGDENSSLARYTLRFSSGRERPTTVARRAPSFLG